MVLQRITAFLGSKIFFWIVLGFFTASAVWIALTSVYPMAFDEGVHFGMIQIYAQHLNPFAVQQTAAANVFGSIATDPSYLYYYLMSFPYRLLTIFTDNQVVQVFMLRLINIGLVVGALLLFRRFFVQTGLSSALGQSVLAIFALIPVTVLLAAQINYDNLALLLVPLLGLIVWGIRSSLRVHHRLPLGLLLMFAVLCLLSSVVKYAFLPIIAGALLYVVYEIIRAARAQQGLLGRLWQDLRTVTWPIWIGTGLLLTVAVLLFSQRYVVNLVRHQALVPDCAAVLSVDACMEWGPWGRDYRYAQDTAGYEANTALAYTIYDWIPGMWNRLFFTLAGPTNDYDTQPRFPIPSITFAVLTVTSLLALAVCGRNVFRRYPVFWLFTALSVLYVAALWLQVYNSQLETHRPVAINGRYLLLLLPLWGVVAAACLSRFLTSVGIRKYRGLLAVVVIILFLQGGGALTYIARAKPVWFYDGWPQTTNMQLQQLVKPLLIDQKP